jgi:hypothetical protein
METAKTGYYPSFILGNGYFWLPVLGTKYISKKYGAQMREF